MLMLGSLRRPRDGLVGKLKSKIDGVDHHSLFKARQWVLPEILKNLVVSPRIVVVKHHDELVCCSADYEIE